MFWLKAEILSYSSLPPCEMPKESGSRIGTRPNTPVQHKVETNARAYKSERRERKTGTCHPRFPDSALVDPSRRLFSCVLLFVIRISFVGFPSQDVQQSLIASAHMQYLEFSSIASSFQCLGQMCPTKAGEKGIERCDTPNHLLTLEHRIASQHGVPNAVYEYNDPWQ